MPSRCMSIESKHAYRFGFLKSEQWQNVRLEALAREGGKCQICGEESISNDAHHVWYPDNIYETKSDQLVILCRPCHDFVHAMLPECKTRDELKGKEEWIKLRNAIIAWRMEKIGLFKHGYKRNSNESVRIALNKLKQACNRPPSPNQKKIVGEAFRQIFELVDSVSFRNGSK